MRYQIKQKALSIADRFSIKDEDGRDAFFVEGKAVRVVDQLRFLDPSGRELATIRQKVLSGTPTYHISRGGKVVATVKRAISLRPKFKLAVEGGGDIEITGKLSALEYEFKEGKRTVALVSKKLFAIADSYGVEVADGADEVLVLATVVAIDQMSALTGNKAMFGGTT